MHSSPFRICCSVPNYGFVIDLRTCIGCHACTVACKAEHDIPIGVNRCWVKTVEKGQFPDTSRFFFPVLCNQCDDAPCVSICPTNALYKRRDGIVDLDGDACIGCRACMVACPYDQLFIDPGTHTAEKCNFCANRVENELLPACVSVCPTECRVFGDLDDPGDPINALLQQVPISVRKPEKGTQPKVFYIAADESVLQPEAATHPLTFKEGQVTRRPLGAPPEDPSTPGAARVDYDVPHEQAWGLDMALYLLTKGIATGALFLAALLWGLGHTDGVTTVLAPAVALLFVTITAGILIADLERPERFYYILTRPNWRSWMVWGAYFLTAHGALATLWLILGLAGGWTAALDWLVVPTLVVSLLATCYTAFLFAQGLARDLWQGPHSVIDLAAQAAAEASAALLLGATLLPIDASAATVRVPRRGAVRRAGRPSRLAAGRAGPHAQPHPASRARSARHHQRALRAESSGAGPSAARWCRWSCSPCWQASGRGARRWVPPAWWWRRSSRSVGASPGSMSGWTPGSVFPTADTIAETMTDESPGPPKRFRSHPHPSTWDDYVDFESTSWPRKERRHYWIIPSICFNCESACGVLAYVDKETLEVRKIEGNPVHPGSRGTHVCERRRDPGAAHRSRSDSASAETDGRAGRRRLGAGVVG